MRQTRQPFPPSRRGSFAVPKSLFHPAGKHVSCHRKAFTAMRKSLFRTSRGALRRHGMRKTGVSQGQDGIGRSCFTIFNCQNFLLPESHKYTSLHTWLIWRRGCALRNRGFSWQGADSAPSSLQRRLTAVLTQGSAAWSMNQSDARMRATKQIQSGGISAHTIKNMPQSAPAFCGMRYIRRTDRPSDCKMSFACYLSFLPKMEKCT